MNLSVILEVLVALVFVYFLFSLIVSGIHEWFTQRSKKRGKMLRFALEEVFNDSLLNRNFAEMMYNHPLFDRMRKKQQDLPAYLSDQIFASCLIDVIGSFSLEVSFKQDPETKTVTELSQPNSPNTQQAFLRFKKGLEKLEYSDLKILLSSFLNQSNDLETLHQTLISWYNDYMDRVTGWYKKSSQPGLLKIGLVVSLVLNVDIFELTQTLWNDAQVRKILVEAAEKYVETHPPTSENLKPKPVISLSDTILKDSLQLKKYQKPATIMPQTDSTLAESLKLVQKLDSIYRVIGAYDLPVGWDFLNDFFYGKSNSYFKTLQKNRHQYSKIYDKWWQYWGVKIFGILISGLLLSQGSPFWFDILNKLVNIRNSGNLPKINKQSNSQKP